MHKVGKGTLVIQTKYTTTPNDNKYGYLRVGDGKVIFNTEHQVFKGVYLTSGRGTLELTKDKAQAFGAVKDTSPIDSKLPHHFKLEQNKADELGIYFGNGGGNLDLKGNSLTLNTISSNDSRANIINTDTDGNNPSYITIEGLGLMILRKRQIKKRIPLSTQVLGKAQILKVLMPIKITI
uniref:S6 family peptidase n=2 Tax=Helicobacter cinaedi TaxID=213 RepID=UPI00227800F3|nr:S6 family peptidase [Helicobacter cinaedi]